MKQELIPIIIFAVIMILKVVGKAAKGNKNADEGSWDSDGGWAPASPNPVSPTIAAPQSQPAKPRPTPSPRVQQILEQLQQQARQIPGEARVVQPVTQPVARPAAQPQQTAASHTTAKRVYLEGDGGPKPEAEVMPPVAAATQSRSSRELYSDTLGKAFPSAVRMVRKATRRSDRKIVVRVQGRQSLRKAILFSEILGPPRAFDV